MEEKEQRKERGKEEGKGWEGKERPSIFIG